MYHYRLMNVTTQNPGVGRGEFWQSIFLSYIVDALMEFKQALWKM